MNSPEVMSNVINNVLLSVYDAFDVLYILLYMFRISK